jgi:tRNA 2-thiouridine synthesizing protein E
MSDELELDEDGFLENAEDWDEEVARKLASLDGIEELTDTHWRVLYFVRDFWFEHDDLPSLRQLYQHCRVRSDDLANLFPNRYPARGFCRVAGLPKPWSCA